MMIRCYPLGLFGFVLATLAACSTPGEARPPAGTVREAPVSLAGVPAAGLPPQTLGRGECGLFLWSQTAPRRFTFFARAGEPAGLAYIEGAARAVHMTDAGAGLFGEFRSEMRFLEVNGARSLRLSLTPGEMMEGGQKVASGSLIVTDAQGWETIVPVAGLRACMPG